MAMRASSLQATNTLAINREIDSKYDAVLEVRDALPEIERLLSLIDEDGTVMTKEVYDTTNNGVVDNSEKLQGKTVAEIIEDAKDSIELEDKTQHADKYLASQSISNILYDSSDNPIKIRYNNNTDVDYEVLTYSGDILTTIQHYINSVLRGTTTLSYSGENLISAIFVGV